MFDEYPIGSFKSYIWCKQDIIGAGATSLVYRASCQETGNAVAVKVFNDAAKSRSNVLQLRELELLHKINHENVVKLIDKDDQNGYKYTLKLLVMEYCNGGSLSSLIEQPENIYGLQQSDFLIVLRHITNGMNELHKLKIVHRDIKPNNILLQILPTGEHVYKLSDFGAARQVEMEDDQFTSICGTEEYLFPDVYERALIDRNIQKSFRAGIDLWSTGVSLYHIATGLLPFRPIGGRHNRATMIKITKEKPEGAISGVQNTLDGQIEYSNELPDTCQLSKKLQELLVPMLSGLMENNYDRMWSFQEFFERSTYICDLIFINIMSLDTCQIIQLPFEKTEKLADLKNKIEKETKIDKSSQLIIYNNLLFDSLVSDQQCIETFPIIDKDHPLVLFSLSNTLSCDNLEIIKQLPQLRSKLAPKTIQEITSWAKETTGSIYYIKREVNLVTMIIELLKLSAIAFKSYMPEMKLKQQNLIYNFKSTIKSLETKINIMDKLDQHFNDIKSSRKYTDLMEIKNDIQKFKTELNIYENEINILTEKINATQNLEFLLQNSTLTSKWKNEIDAYCSTSQQIYDDLLHQKKDIRTKQDQEKFERSKFTDFKLKRMRKTKDDAVKLYQDTAIVHFFDFYLRFEKWMSDLIKLHNDLMSVQQKLVELEDLISAPVDSIDAQLDGNMNALIDIIINTYNDKSLPMTPTSVNGMASLKDSSASSIKSKTNEIMNSIDSAKNFNFDSLVTSIKDFRLHTQEMERALDENCSLLKILQDHFQKTRPDIMTKSNDHLNQTSNFSTG